MTGRQRAVRPGDVPDEGVRIVEEDAPAPSPRSMPGETYIKYVGTSGVRIIRKEEWATVGIEAPTVVWNAGNVWTVNASDLPDKAVEWCRDNEPDLLLLHAGDERLV